MNFKNWRKTATLLHRDVGYFFAGVVVVYAISGIALNHKEDWDPSFVVERLEVETPYRADNKDTVTRESVTRLLGEKNIGDTYRGHDFPSASKLKVFTKKGSLFVNLDTGTAEYEALKRRPFFYQVNFLHQNPGRAWTFFSDAFCGGLLLVTITGLVMRKGKHGLKGRGGILAALGILVPIVFLVIY